MKSPTRKRSHNQLPKHTGQDNERVGATLRQLRIDRGATQSELATGIGFRHASSIAQIETGLKPLTDDKLMKAAKFLGVRPIVIRRPDLEQS